MTEKQRRTYLEDEKNWKLMWEIGDYFRVLRLDFKGVVYLKVQARIKAYDWEKSSGTNFVYKASWGNDQMYYAPDGENYLERVNITHVMMMEIMNEADR